MRIDAPIPALLALAAILLSPVSGLARPTHSLAHKAPALAPEPKHVRRHPASSAADHHSAHPRTAVAAMHPRQKPGSQRAEARVVKPSTNHAQAPERVSRTETRRHRARREVIHQAAAETQQPAAAQIAASRKATSEDFLRAAAAPADSPAITDATPAPGEPTSVDHAALRSVESAVPAKTARETKPAASQTPASEPVGVVGVVRPGAERPQLPSVEEAAATPQILPSLYNKRGRLIVPAPLKGSHEILVHQNLVADKDGLDRIKDDDDLIEMRNRRLLVALPVNSGIQVDERLPINRRYCRPWASQFLVALARAHYAEFHRPLQVNSAVRTVDFQEHLIHVNGNAAPAEGETASPHLTGQAVDIAKHGLSLAEIAWMRSYLLPLMQEGKIDVEEEFQQACFHISVYKKYSPGLPEREEASTHRAAALATALR